MNAMMKLTAAALGAMSIAGGVALAQTTSTDPNDGRTATANYGTPPGAPLKRDGSMRTDPTPATPVTDTATDTSSTTRTTTSSTTWNNPPAAPAATDNSMAAPAPDTSASTTTTDTTPAPRADRN